MVFFLGDIRHLLRTFAGGEFLKIASQAANQIPSKPALQLAGGYIKPLWIKSLSNFEESM